MVKTLQSSKDEYMQLADRTNSGRRVYFLGLPVDSFSVPELLQLIDDCICRRVQKVFFALHVHSVNIFFDDPEYRRVLQNSLSDYFYIDGVGVRWGGKLLGMPMGQNIPTTDLILYICDYLKKNNKTYRVFFLGGENQSGSRAKSYFETFCPNLKVIGVYEPPFLSYEELEKQETEKILNLINTIDYDILFVGFGAPKQERWIFRKRDKIKAPIIIPCGGLYGFYSGDYKRAPLFMRKLGLEWFFRLLLEPKKRFSRYVTGNFIFLGRLLKAKWSINGRYK